MKHDERPARAHTRFTHPDHSQTKRRDSGDQPQLMCGSNLWLLKSVSGNWWSVEMNRVTTDDRKCSCTHPIERERNVKQIPE